MLAAALYALTFTAAAQQKAAPIFRQGHLVDARGFINVWQLRKDVMKVEAAAASDDTSHCRPESSPGEPPGRKQKMRLLQQEKDCIRRVQRAFANYQSLRQSFNTRWQPLLQEAIRKGDPVAEVIWRQCNTTPIIERSALASTCDSDPARRAEAALRLRQIGFEAALDPVAGLSEASGGNSVRSPEQLAATREFAADGAASILVRRGFTYVRRQGVFGYESHAQLRLNRKPLGTSTLAWGATVFHSATQSPHNRIYDPVRNGYKVYLNYGKGGEAIVGGNRDALYLRTLYEELMRSEQGIDDWLKRDPRWAVFLLHRHGHHEWVPEGMQSPFGRLNPTWGGKWVLDKRFVNFEPVVGYAQAQLNIRVGDASIAQFAETGTPGYACELRYSGANSERPEDNNHAKTAGHTVLGYLPALSLISAHANGPVAPFAPMNPHKVYRQVLVQCPQGEWPDNRNKRFLFLAQNTMIEVQQAQGSRDLIIQHWRRKAPLSMHTDFSPLAPPFDLKPVIDRLEQEARLTEQADARIAMLRTQVGTLEADELIASLAQWRLEKAFYSPASDFPDNLIRLIDTPDISTRICTAYRTHPADALQRFNFMVVLNMRTRKGLLTPEEIARVPDCLRLALNDQDAWVRLEAVDVFARFAEEKDRAKLMELQHDPDEDVRFYNRNALNRLRDRK